MKIHEHLQNAMSDSSHNVAWSGPDCQPLGVVAKSSVVLPGGQTYHVGTASTQADSLTHVVGQVMDTIEKSYGPALDHMPQSKLVIGLVKNVTELFDPNLHGFAKPLQHLVALTPDLVEALKPHFLFLQRNSDAIVFALKIGVACLGLFFHEPKHEA